jgi:hypothetical protein
MPTSNDRFREAFDWAPEYPTYREGLDQVVERWRADGVIREAGRENGSGDDRTSGEGFEWTAA